ncbi:fibronectin type III domain-containing protein [Mumia sp. Pv 4-285]|uniref:fibronectin type III domain-containing protein n=1 Tax=Mumia qirimensis TaxID=3234852 RepID=UPI00351D6809
MPGAYGSRTTSSQPQLGRDQVIHVLRRARTLGAIVGATLVASLLVLVPGASDPASAASAAPTAASCAKSGRWLAQYYKGTSFTGKPVRKRCEKRIAASYPASRQPFAVRWSRTRTMKGSYELRARATGTATLRIDRRKVATASQGRYAAAVRTLRKRKHTVEVRYVKGVGAGSVHAQLVKAPDRTPPARPGGLRAVAGDRAVALAWKAPRAIDVRGYRVYRDGRLVQQVATRAVTDIGLTNGVAMAYAVVAVDHRGNASRAARVSVTPKDQVAPQTPTDLVATAGDGTVALRWDQGAASDLSSYVLRRSGGGADKTWTLPTSATSVVDAPVVNGTVYAYSLVARDTSGNTSAPALAGAVPADAAAPSTPAGFEAIGKDACVELSWTANTESDLAGYVITRMRSDGIGAPAEFALGAGATRFSDTSAKNGVAYAYTIVARDTSGNRSGGSTAPATARDMVPPAVPQGLASAVDDGAVVLRWTAPTDDTASYTVWRSDDGDEFVKIGVAVGTAPTYTDHDVAEKVLYRYRIVAVDGAGNVSAPSGPADVTLPDTDAPETPRGLAVEARDGRVELTWTPNGEDDLAGYRVYRSVAGAPSQELADLGASAAGFSDVDVVNGTTYTYAISAYDDDDNESGRTTGRAATPLDRAAPAVPSGLAAEAGEGQVALRWNANAEGDLAAYVIVRTGGAGDPTQFQVDAGTATYVDTTARNGTTYAYVIHARDRVGNVSAASLPVTATPQDVTPPAVPQAFAAVPGDREVRLSWDAGTEDDLASYTLFRAAGAGALAELATVDGTVTAYTDAAVVNDTRYRYAIAATDAAGNVSVVSAEVAAAPTDLTAPAPPATPTARARDREVALAWTANTERDIAGYRIYRATTPDVPIVGNGIARLLPTPAYTDKDVANGTTYYYVVVAVDTHGNVSAPSGSVAATPEDVTPPAEPTGLVALVARGAVALDWADSDASDLDHYLVYRVTVGGEPPLGDEPPLAEATASSYVDAEVGAGTSYEYWVVAVDTAGNASAASLTVAVTTPAQE